MITIDKIKQLREETEISLSECRKALESAGGDLVKAREILKQWGREVAQKKKTRETNQGIIDSYIHPNKKVGVLLELNCETDFVAKSPDFQSLSHELCLQIAGSNDEAVPLLEQPWIKDDAKKIKEVIDDAIAKIGENISVKRYVKYSLIKYSNEC